MVCFLVSSFYVRAIYFIFKLDFLLSYARTYILSPLALTPPGIEPATFRLVAQRLKQLLHHVAPYCYYYYYYYYRLIHVQMKVDKSIGVTDP